MGEATGFEKLDADSEPSRFEPEAESIQKASSDVASRQKSRQGRSGGGSLPDAAEEQEHRYSLRGNFKPSFRGQSGFGPVLLRFGRVVRFRFGLVSVSVLGNFL